MFGNLEVVGLVFSVVRVGRIFKAWWVLVLEEMRR